MHVRLIGNLKLSVGVNVSVNGLPPCGPEMNWRFIQGVTLPSPVTAGMNEWMTALMEWSHTPCSLQCTILYCPTLHYVSLSGGQLGCCSSLKTQDIFTERKTESVKVSFQKKKNPPCRESWQKSPFVTCTPSKETVLFQSRGADKVAHQQLIVSSRVVHSRWEVLSAIRTWMSEEEPLIYLIRSVIMFN